jgi:hypothetical protein
MTSRQHVRLDQVAELTRGVELPLPNVEAPVLELVIEAVALAWDHVLMQHPKIAKQGDEAEINAVIETWLNGQLPSIPSLDLFVSGVDRGRESISFDGKRIETRPDLSFRLTHVDARFRLLAECKIIDKASGKTTALYRSNGIARFVNGDYAWGCREAIMLAYVRCGSSLQGSLLRGLSRYPEMAWVQHEMKSHPCLLIARDALGTSTHARSFSYVHNTTRTPGPIDLWHLWLEAT